MSDVLILAIAAAVVLLAVGGYVATQRRTRGRSAALHAQVAAADQALAQAVADDRGWDRERIEGAARTVFSERHPGAAVEELHLVQVLDRPGTDEDAAVFRVRSSDGEHEVQLARRGDDWFAAG